MKLFTYSLICFLAISYSYASSGLEETSSPMNISELSGNHTIRVERNAYDSGGLGIIKIAENTYPDRKEVIEAIKTAHFKVKSIPDEKRLWWYSEFDPVRIPYAITTEAIDYYVRLVRSNRKWESDITPRSNLFYSANVVYCPNLSIGNKTFKDIYVVTMILKFSEQTGSEGGISFGKLRIAIIKYNRQDRKYEVIDVYGDGKTEVEVS